MKTLKLLFASVLVLFVFAVPVFATSTTVVGPGTHVDIQAALDDAANYDIVYLQGEFDFGTDGSVSITRDVEIIGVGTAKIIGGENSISCHQNVKLTVKDLTLEECTRAAFYVTSASQVEITGCTIKNIKKAVSYQPVPPYTRSAGIYLTMPNITGNVTISANTINLNVALKDDDNYLASFQIGILLSYTYSNAQITGNFIYNCNYAGIAIISNPGEVTIADNVVETGPPMPDLDDPIYGGLSYGNGIDVFSNAVLPAGSASVIDNIVTCVNPMADGIVFSGEPFLSDATHLISGNILTMGVSEEERCYYGGGSCGVNNSVWENNTVEGYMDYSMAIMGAKCENNEFRNNILGGSDVSLAHISMERGATKNRSINNDFTTSSEPGWHLGGPGCVLLGAGANKNYVNETLFPGDDGVCEQVLGIEGNIVENDIGGYNPGMCNAYNNMYEQAEAIVSQKMLEMQERRAAKYLQLD